MDADERHREIGAEIGTLTAAQHAHSGSVAPLGTVQRAAAKIGV